MKDLRDSLDRIFISGLLILLIFSTVCGQNASDAGVLGWLKTNGLPLKYRTAGNGFDDLRPLRETLRDVRIVGLGEATHGTHEHFAFKHRIVEFLVRELGFTVFAIEAQYFRCRPLNDFVLGAGGRPEDAARLVGENLPGIYRTEELLELVRWMRAYNDTVPPEKKVAFYGFDVQTPHHAADFLRTFLKKTDPAYLFEAEKVLAATAPKDFKNYWLGYGKRTPSQKKLLRGRLLQLLGFLAAGEMRLVRRSSRAEFETALAAARVLVQSDAIRSTPEARLGTSENPRDRFMAETVESLLSRASPGAKAILWAHNFHVWNYPPDSNAATTAALKKNGLDFRPMGNFLKEFFGDKYYSFGFVMDAGAFQAIDDEASDEATEPQEFTLKSSPPNGFGRYFSRAALGDFLLDLRNAPPGAEVDAWLAAPHLLRFAGASFSNKWTEEEFSVPVVARDGFDGLIFIEKTTRARSLGPDSR